MACSRAAAKIYPLLREGSGPILSQQGSFALFARGEIYIQLFHFTALSRAGVWDQAMLLKEIDAHAFSWVITEFPIEDPVWTADDLERFTPEMAEALRRNYRREQAFYPYYLYRPRTQRVIDGNGERGPDASRSRRYNSYIGGGLQAWKNSWTKAES